MNCKRFNIFGRVIKFIFPIVEIIIASKRLSEKEKRINEGNYFEYVQNYEELEVNELEELQKECFSIKAIFEDKAKISTIGISVSITIILGLLTFVLSFFQDYCVNKIFLIMIIITIIYCLINMIIAGVLSLDLIGNLNVFYKIFPNQYRLGDHDKKQLLAMNIELNVIYNIKRNNHLFASFKSLILSSVSLMLVFALMLLPVHTKLDKTNDIREISQSIDEIRNVLTDYYSKDVNNLQIVNNNINEIKEYLKNNLENEEQIIKPSIDSSKDFKDK